MPPCPDPIPQGVLLTRDQQRQYAFRLACAAAACGHVPLHIAMDELRRAYGLVGACRA
jgi:hypothetical protein